jgi:hypothetical protein
MVSITGTSTTLDREEGEAAKEEGQVLGPAPVEEEVATGTVELLQQMELQQAVVGEVVLVARGAGP